MLFEPLKIREITLRNRIMVSPMCQYSYEDGFSNDWHLVHLGSRAVGGSGIVMVEATAVEAGGRITSQDLGIWQDEHIPNLQRVTKFIESQGAVSGIQLAHAGRKASIYRPWDKRQGAVSEKEGGWRPVVAPSAIPFDDSYVLPEALTIDGITKIIDSFVKAAKRALKAGFRIVEIHCAHGYLLHEFLSPIANQRTDMYGGSFENRIRLSLEVVRAVRHIWPEDLAVFVRISATDWLEPQGWDLEQSIKLARILKKEGVDLIDCSSGAMVSYAKIPAGPGYQVLFSERVHQEADIMTGAVGIITQATQAETILESGQASVIVIGRQFLRDPYWPLHAAMELKAKVKWPCQYHLASPTSDVICKES
jgi:2,4-dienoyl-CoA reductase-like NADH-dependent reductase (Old Yellow Enzyme family)